MNEHNSIDLLTVLRADELPVQPNPAFAARLRARLESALSLPRRTQGVLMSGTDKAVAELPDPTRNAVSAWASPRPAALPYLIVANTREAIAFYVDALGAIVIGDPIVMEDGRIGHAELAVGGGVLYLADENPEMGLKAPVAGAVSVSLMLQVPDTDASLARARDRGAIVERDIHQDYGARGATIIDPSGHRWMFSGPVIGAVSQIRHGDIGYASVWTANADRAAAFYGQVLGWIYDPTTHQVTNTVQHIGIFSVAVQPTLFCCYAVADLQAAGQAITEAGGTVDEVEQFPFGAVLGATDPAGTAFAVYQPAGDQARPDLNGAGPGELSYVTYEVADSATFREFYSRVLHWAFEPGHVDDGWQLTASHPMAGVAGGGDTPITVPMWTVSDIGAAVSRVRAAGGTVIQEPTRRPYGLMAECTDDQDGRFYLGEF
jgi:uncharacterized glyoxalase superfamily protein PhnB